jgi:IPT/TIG domain
VIVLYGTGEGLATPTPADGAISQPPTATPQLPVTVAIGGAPAEVLYAAAAPGLAAGAIQINARIPTSITYSHHLPVTWSAGSYTSQSGVTIAVNDAPPPAFVFQPATNNPLLAVISVSPSRIVADSGDTIVTISGSGFTSGMIVEWNNRPKTTTFLDSTRLQVILTGNDLETPELGSIVVWDSARFHKPRRCSSICRF